MVGAGTGGTSATIGRFIRYRRHATRLCVVDPENSAFFPAYAQGRSDVVTGSSSRIEGIGRPRVEPSFLPDVVDRMVTVPDAASVAAARHASRVLGRRVGPSTGTNLWGAFGLLAEMVAEGRSGSVVTLLADSGDRYSDTYFCDEWLTKQRAGPVRLRRCAGRVRAIRALALIVGLAHDGPVGRQEQPQRGQGEESQIDGRPQPSHLVPHFVSLSGNLPSVCITPPTTHIHPAAYRDVRRGADVNVARLATTLRIWTRFGLSCAAPRCGWFRLSSPLSSSRAAPDPRHGPDRAGGADLHWRR